MITTPSCLFGRHGSTDVINLAEKGHTRGLEKRLNSKPPPELRDIEEALLTAIRHGNDDAILPLVVAGVRRLDCALYLAIQLERVKAIASLLLCKATITGDCQAIRSLLSEPPDCGNAPWYMPEVNRFLSQGAIRMSYPIAVSIMEKNYEATKELLLRTDLDMRRKQVDWSKLKLTLLHPSWMYSISPWVVSLKLINNHLRKLPKELFCASQLRRLDLSHNLLESVSPDIFNLPNLEYLSLSHNRLREVHDTPLWSASLLSLDLSENNLQSLPPGIQYSCIEILNLSKNQFSTVPKCLCRIRTLTSLDLSSMPITSLPKEMENLDHLVNLNVSNANISDLPAGGILRGAMKGIFKARARSNKPCTYAKVVILCHSDLTKTVMYTRLKQNVAKPSSLPEIDLFQWSYRPLFTKAKFFSTQKLFFNTWMIGSAFEYSCIYPCFFTVNALYVIGCDVSRSAEMREQIKVYIDLLTRYVPKANVCVVGILPDGYEAWAESNLESVVRRVNKLFSSPVYQDFSYHGLSIVAENANIKDGHVDVRQRIYDVASTMSVNGQQVIGRYYPENYFSLIPVLEKEQQTFATRDKPGVLVENTMCSLFDKALCADPPDKMELPVITEFLQEAGFLLHFEDPNDRLDQYYFMRPYWLYNTLLRVVRHALTHSNHVVVTYSEICSLANVDWSKDVSSALVRLMTRFAIALPVTDNLFLIPCLLPHCNPSPDLLNIGELRRQFAPKTRALPADLWYRIISRVISNLQRITEIVEVRRKVISKDSKQPSSVVAADNQDGKEDERAGGTDEETNAIGTTPRRYRKLHRLQQGSLSRGSSEPSLPSLSTEQLSESTTDGHENEAFSPKTIPLVDVCLLSETDEICRVPLPGDPTAEPTDTSRYVTTKKYGNAQESKVPASVSQNSETSTVPNETENEVKELLTGDVTVEDGTEPLDEVDKHAQPRSQKIPIPTDDQAASKLTSRNPPLAQSSLDLPDGMFRASSLPVGHVRPRIQRAVSMQPPVRRGSQAEPILIERGLQVWNCGITYSGSDVQFAIYPCNCEMSSVEERGVEICTTGSSTGRIIFARLCKLVQKLFEERYPDLFSIDVPLHMHELTQLAICPVCVNREEKHPTSFLVEACVHALTEKDLHTCRYHTESVPLRDLIPDYFLVDLPSAYHLTSSSFQLSDSKPLHRSRAMSLHAGVFQGENVAVKIHHPVDGCSITLPLASIRQEMDMLVNLDHPNIVRTFGFCLQPPCVLLERAPHGNLYQKLMDTEQRITRTARFHIACQVGSALQYLHANNIIYRTLKASSILVWSLDFRDKVGIKLANFERAELKMPSGLMGKTYFSSYPAPEMVRYSFREEYSEKVDVYSFGILLYELVTRWQPFGGVYNSERVPVSLSQRPKLSGVITTGYGGMVKLMQECWQEEITERPGAGVLLQKLSQPAFQCHLATQVLRDCVSVRGCCFIPNVRQIWVYGEYNRTSTYGEAAGFDTIEGTQVFILNAESLTVQGSLELKERASSIYTVDAKVWIGMTEACVHAYDTSTFKFTDRFYSKDSVTVIADNDTFAFVAQANGQLTYFPKLTFPKESYEIDVGKKPIISMITFGDVLWLSCGNEIVILNADEGVSEETRWAACDETDQIYALVLSKDTSTVWSLVRGGHTITSWDATNGKKKDSVDLTRELTVICCELNYDPSFLRVISLECINDTLWLGLTCGVIVILSATDHPEKILHFRAHKHSTKCLMEVPSGDRTSQENSVILSGGFGEVSSVESTVSEQNGVIMSWHALTADEFRLLSERRWKYSSKLATSGSHKQ